MAGVVSIKTMQISLDGVPIEIPDVEGVRMCKTAYIPARCSWLGVVFKIMGDELHVLSFGEEMTEESINRWADDTLQLMDDADDDNVEAPDMHDRPQN